MTELTDWRGTPIEVGSTVVYPGRRGASVWVNEGVVEEITSVEGWRRTVPALKVKRTRDSYGSDSWMTTGKTSTLTALERVTVVGGP